MSEQGNTNWCVELAETFDMRELQAQYGNDYDAFYRQLQELTEATCKAFMAEAKAFLRDAGFGENCMELTSVGRQVARNARGHHMAGSNVSQYICMLVCSFDVAMALSKMPNVAAVRKFTFPA